MNSYHALLLNKRNIDDRLDEGNNCDLAIGHLDGKDWVLKQGHPDGDTPCLYREWMNLISLQPTGLVPEVHKGIDPREEYQIATACIHGAVTVCEYVEAYLNEVVPFEVLAEVLAEVSAGVNKFHSLGWVHGDLHGKNLLVDYVEGWKVYIIDVPFATKNGLIPRDLRGLNLKQDPTVETHILGWCLGRTRRANYKEILQEKLEGLIGELFPQDSDWDGQ